MLSFEEACEEYECVSVEKGARMRNARFSNMEWI